MLQLVKKLGSRRTCLQCDRFDENNRSPHGGLFYYLFNYQFDYVSHIWVENLEALENVLILILF
jgi:hypothetical protein